MAVENVDYAVDLSELNEIDYNGNSSLSSWSAYSVSYIYDSCPNITLDRVESYLENVVPVYSHMHRIYIEYVLPFLLSAGVVGNILFIYLVCSMKPMRTATNWCLANLALADLIFLGFGIGEKIWMYHQSPFINDRLSFGEFGCPVIFAFIDASYLAALCMVTLVSMERYYAVCRTQSARTNTRKSLFTSLVILSWIVSVAIALSFVPASNYMYVGCNVWPNVEPYKHFPTHMGSCTATPKLQRYPLYVMIGKTVPYFLLIMINIWLYACIVASLTLAVKETRFAGRVDTNLAQRNQVARMLIINGVIFFTCLVPFEIFCLMKAVNMMQPVGKTFFGEQVIVPLRYVSQAMSYINNVINPVVYIGLSKKYRDAFKNAILRCRQVQLTSRKQTRKRLSTTTSTAMGVHQKSIAVHQ